MASEDESKQLQDLIQFLRSPRADVRNATPSVPVQPM